MNIILASSSIYRKALFQRLHLPFECLSPDIDESPLNDESHESLVVRLSCEKAKKAGKQFPDAVCIGSDTVASIDNHILGKPSDHAHAREQLSLLSEQTVRFLTGVCVHLASKDLTLSGMVPTTVRFKKLSQSMIESYLTCEKPYQSSASFKAETSGIALIESMQSDDPTAITGLPLIELCRLLEQAGIKVH